MKITDPGASKTTLVAGPMKDPPGDYMWVDIGPMKQPHVVTGGFIHWPNVDPHVVTGGVLPERTPVGTGKQRQNPGEDKHPTRNRERGVFWGFYSI